ncbi:MAG: exo-beta-N-acetylmuramidase NamZ domain-containing protein [Oligoflexales bacterium]
MKIGLERLQADPSIAKHWGRCALVVNQASVTKEWKHSVHVCQEAFGKDRLVALMAPQHGVLGTVQDNMIETEHDMTGSLPVYSLYSETREPTEQMLQNVDTIVVDLQNVGCRVYTFKWTLVGCLRAAQKFDCRVVVLDRPNPLGGRYIEGPCVEEELFSFVGGHAVPMRHGLTLGEMGSLANTKIHAEYDVVGIEGWNPELDWSQDGRDWVLTSPNLPTLDTVLPYVGTVIFEGTNISEGRGTGMPFQLIGAPWVKDGDSLGRAICDAGLDQGLKMRSVGFMPTSGKWKDQECRGLHLKVTDIQKARMFAMSVVLCDQLKQQGGDRFAWKEPPYEYEYTKNPMKLILGTEASMASLERGHVDLKQSLWTAGHEEYIESVQSILKYPRSLETLM